MTRDDKGAHGIAVMKFLDAEFTARPDALTTWARDNGIDPSKFTKWRRGESDPDLAGLEEIADALGRPTWQLLVAADLVDPRDIGAPPIPMTPMPDIDHAIQHDPSLTDGERVALAAVRAGLRDVESPAVSVIVPRPKAKPRAKRSHRSDS